MAVFLALVFGLFGVAVVGALAVYGDRTVRRIVAFSVVVVLALAVWWWSLPAYPPQP